MKQTKTMFRGVNMDTYVDFGRYLPVECVQQFYLLLMEEFCARKV